MFFGDPKAPHEVLVLLDFASRRRAKRYGRRGRGQPLCFASAVRWQFLPTAGNIMEPTSWAWASGFRIPAPVSHAVHDLCALALERDQGRAKEKGPCGCSLNNEYDATAESSDYPIHYSYMTKLRPPVNPAEELAVGKYCYNTGNVNLYQAQQISQYFGIKALPAVVVDDNVLSSVSASAILKAME